MIITYDAESTCPICGTRLTIRHPGGCFPTGQDSDLLVRMDGEHLIQVEIHSCRRCSFSGLPADFEVTLQRAQTERFLAEVAPELGGQGEAAALPDLRYFRAYRCAAFLSRPDFDRAIALIRAYWCLRLSPSSEIPEERLAERRKVYLSGALHHLRQDIRESDSPIRLYLLAELSRRYGVFPSAVGFFKRFLDASTRNADTPRYLRLAAAKLLRVAERSDGREMTMEELVYADSPE